MKAPVPSPKPKTVVKSAVRRNHPDDEKKMDARRRIEDIELQREWEKTWGMDI